MPMFKIQPAPRIDMITDDGHVGTQLPYPIHADNKGGVEFPEIHAGHVVRIIGFQKDLAVKQIDLSWSEAQKHPDQVVGMYLVSSDSEGTWGVHDTAVETFEEVTR
jgi:hypothetical protein